MVGPGRERKNTTASSQKKAALRVEGGSMTFQGFVHPALAAELKLKLFFKNVKNSIIYMINVQRNNRNFPI